jgi:hypothetical protein
MYCPSCANPVKDGLKYCNSCGERLGRDAEGDNSPGKMLDDVLDTLFWTAILSLGILVGLVAVLLSKDVKQELVGVVIVAYLVTVFGICFTLIRQVPKLIDARLKKWSVGEDDASPQINRRTTAQLEEFREPAMSVTDHTTKTLDKVPVGRRR